MNSFVDGIMRCLLANFIERSRLAKLLNIALSLAAVLFLQCGETYSDELVNARGAPNAQEQEHNNKNVLDKHKLTEQSLDELIMTKQLEEYSKKRDELCRLELQIFSSASWPQKRCNTYKQAILRLKKMEESHQALFSGCYSTAMIAAGQLPINRADRACRLMQPVLEIYFEAFPSDDIFSATLYSVYGRCLEPVSKPR